MQMPGTGRRSCIISPMLTIIIKQGKENAILAGDPYIYLSAIERVDGRPAEKNKPGATATVVSSSRKFLARAAYNAKSQIAARVWTLREDEAVDHAMVKRRVRAAIARRRHSWIRPGPMNWCQSCSAMKTAYPACWCRAMAARLATLCASSSRLRWKHGKSASCRP